MSPQQQGETPVGWREEKKRRTRLDLCVAARRLALEHGLDAMTIDDVAKAVGVSPRTFFNYYDTKMDAVVGPVEDIGTEPAQREFIAGGPTGVLIDDLTALYVSSYEPEDEARESISLVTQLVMTEPRVLAAFVAAGVQHESTLAELLAARAGGHVAPEFAGLAAGIMSTLTTRAAWSLAADPDRTLAEALRAQGAMAADLFRRPDDRRKR
ncbi:TetR/AcrR family transcriptional regulator [Nocardia jejuensis]|uniref:TetR/AcrR family transcriptional regulator n=1 Tax=Nocardia jejuensis TaxID=328049 RepID=UPI00083401CD|nr:TetR/AcrR family transcriptional regulator [Nocardia jejuensis]